MENKIFVTKAILPSMEEYVAEIFRRLREHGYDESTMKLYVCGGGGCLIRNFAKYDENRVFINSDIRATAKGYESWAFRLLEKADTK